MDVDGVLTSGGLIGHIIDIDDDRVTLEPSVGASFVVHRQYIVRKMNVGIPDVEDDDDEADDDGHDGYDAAEVDEDDGDAEDEDEDEDTAGHDEGGPDDDDDQPKRSK